MVLPGQFLHGISLGVSNRLFESSAVPTGVPSQVAHTPEHSAANIRALLNCENRLNVETKHVPAGDNY